MRPLRELTLVLAILAGAVGGSQVPRFVQEYEQRLGGALQEAGRQLGEYRRVAEQNRLDFAEYRRRLTESAERPVADTGLTIAATARRAAELGAQAADLDRAPRLLRPVVLLAGHDPDLLRATWERFEATLTLDPAFAALGALLGWCLNTLAWGLPGRRGRRAGERRHRPPPPPGQPASAG